MNRNNAAWVLSLSLLLCSSSGYAAPETKLAASSKVDEKSKKAGPGSTTGSGPASGPGSATASGPAAKAAAHAKPKLLTWTSAPSTKNEDGRTANDERTYNLFKNNMGRRRASANEPKNWRTFDPTAYAKKKKLVPDPDLLAGLGPTKYPNADLAFAQDPTKTGAIAGNGCTIVFAHQGTPLANGWIAPQAGYAYQMEGVLVYGTTDYTPINYNGKMVRHLGLGRIPVEIMGPGGTRQRLDMGRLVFAVNDNLLSRPQSRIFPSIMYLRAGETASIQGHGNVSCPSPGKTEIIAVQTPNGEQTIKVLCAPDNAEEPGKITP